MPAHRAMPEDFWKYVEKTDGCWLWKGYTRSTGYGQIMRRRKNLYAHRYAYELECGPIPEGLTLDHLCRVRNCVNPDHLEPVPIAVNLARGTGVNAVNAAKTSCPKGHPYDEANTRHYRNERYCRACDRLRGRRKQQR